MTDINTPLTPAVFYILLALATGDKHGYAIMKQVKSDSKEKITMSNGTLYGSIKRMLEDKLIQAAGIKEEGTERRKYYRLTDKGRQALTSEMQRYVETAQLIQNRKLLPLFQCIGVL